MKFILFSFLCILISLSQNLQTREPRYTKVYNIVEYIKRDTTFIKDSSTMDLLCINVQVKSANLPNLGRKFMFYLIDSVYYLRYNSKQMNNVIKKKYDSILSIHYAQQVQSYLPPGLYFNNCLTADYAITFDLFSDSISVVEVRPYPVLHTIPWSPVEKRGTKFYTYLFKTDKQGHIINVLKTFTTP